MTPNELAREFMLALCVWREARGEPLRGKQLVAQVIRNRVEDRRWPNTYVGVITQRLQFSAFNLGDPNCLLYPAESDPTWADCVAAARLVINAETPLSPANHYHTTGVSPKWQDPAKLVEQAGHHLFYNL